MELTRRKYDSQTQREILDEVIAAKKTVSQIAKKRKMPTTTIYSWMARDGISFKATKNEASKDDIDRAGDAKPSPKKSSSTPKSSKMITSLKLERDYYKQQMEYFMGLYFKSCKK
jgi:transposase-like protein